MSARLAISLAAAAVLLSSAALAIAVMALTRAAPGSWAPIIDAPAASVPAKDEPAEYTKSLVRDAIQRYEREGLQATIDYYNRTENVDGAWYVFIVNNYGYTIAHHNPKLRNRDPSLRVDATGRFYGDDLVGATEKGRWVDYVFVNPATGEETQKHTWAVKRDGLIFASGWYEGMAVTRDGPASPRAGQRRAGRVHQIACATRHTALRAGRVAGDDRVPQQPRKRRRPMVRVSSSTPMASPSPITIRVSGIATPASASTRQGDSTATICSAPLRRGVGSNTTSLTRTRERMR